MWQQYTAAYVHEFEELHRCELDLIRTSQTLGALVI